MAIFVNKYSTECGTAEVCYSAVRTVGYSSDSLASCYYRTTLPMLSGFRFLFPFFTFACGYVRQTVLAACVSFLFPIVSYGIAVYAVTCPGRSSQLLHACACLLAVCLSVRPSVRLRVCVRLCLRSANTSRPGHFPVHCSVCDVLVRQCNLLS